MSAGRALLRAMGRRRSRRRALKAPEAPPVFWGRVGAYEGVTRRGVLFLLAPEPVHPSRQVTNGA